MRHQEIASDTRRHRASIMTIGLIIALSVGCSSDVSVTAPRAPDVDIDFGRDLSILSGNGQTGRPGERLAEPFRIRVSRSDGLPAEGADVYWRVIAGGGRVPGERVRVDGEPGDATLTQTDARGISSAFLVTGPIAGRNEVRVTVLFAGGRAMFVANTR